MGGDRNLTNLRFADDMLIFAKTEKELLQMLQSSEIALRSVGLDLNVEKTVVITNDGNPTHIHSLSGERIEVLEQGCSTKYLGARIGFGLDGNDHMSARINAAWASYTNIRQALQDRSSNTIDKLKLFDLVVSPAALYSIGTCNFRAQDIERLKVVQRRMLRKIVGTTQQPEQGRPRIEWEEWHRANIQKAESLLIRAGGKLWEYEVRGKAWDWAGHVLRMPADRWPNQVLHLKPQKMITRGVQVNGERHTQVITVLPGELEAVRQQGTGNRQWLQQFVRHVRELYGSPPTAPRFQGQRRLDFEQEWFEKTQSFADNRHTWNDQRRHFCEQVCI